MATTAEIEAQIAAIDAKIATLTASVAAGYSIDGQSRASSTGDLKALIEAKSLLIEQLNASYGPWEVETIHNVQ